MNRTPIHVSPAAGAVRLEISSTVTWGVTTFLT
jgi:hypothetical protein